MDFRQIFCLNLAIVKEMYESICYSMQTHDANQNNFGHVTCLKQYDSVK